MIYIALALILTKYILQHHVHYLDVMPSSDVFTKYIEHSHLILLIAVPATHWTVYLLWAAGAIAYIDDWHQERRRMKGKETAKADGLITDESITARRHPGITSEDMYYRGKLHQLGRKVGLI